jgi:bifunctional DNA-binding transcriptional regulator/antitoxin component of YhaV-PrlF toxin-antitoxin module
MYYNDFMTYLASVSSRGLLYLPKEVQKKLKLVKPGKVYFRLENDRLYLEAAPDFFSLAGSLKGKKIRDDIDERKFFEENYERI